MYFSFSKILAQYSYSDNSSGNKVHVCMYVCMYEMEDVVNLCVTQYYICELFTHVGVFPRKS